MPQIIKQAAGKVAVCNKRGCECGKIFFYPIGGFQKGEKRFFRIAKNRAGNIVRFPRVFDDRKIVRRKKIFYVM